MRRKLLVLCSAVLLLMLGISASNMIGPASGDDGLGSDWPMFRHNPAHTGFSNTIGPVHPLLMWNYQTDGEVKSSPAVVSGKLYVGSNDDYVYCLNVSNGNLIWRYQTGNDVISSPCVVNDKVYVGSLDSHLYCLNASNGNLIWRYQSAAGFHSSPLVFNNNVYVGSSDNWIYCLDADTGNLVWGCATNGQVRSSPAFDEGRVYVGSWDGYVYCLNANNGSLVWKYNATHIDYSSPTVTNGKIYIGSDDYHIYCLNASNGNLIWKYRTNYKVASSPAVVDGKVYIGSLDHLCIYCLNASNGNFIWTHGDYSNVHSSPAIVDNKVYLGMSSYIYCLNANHGGLVWDYQTNGEIFSSPAVVDQRLYIGSDDGNVYSIGEESILVWGVTDFTMGVSTTNVTLHVHSNQPIHVHLAAVDMPPPSPPQFYQLGSAFEITVNISSGFNITIFYYYTDHHLATLGLAESTLAIYYWNETDSSWNELPTSVNAANNELTAVPNHLTIFAVFGQAAPLDGGIPWDNGTDPPWFFIIGGIAAISAIGIAIVVKPRSPRVREPAVVPVTESISGPTYEDEAEPEEPLHEEIAPESVEAEEFRPLPPSDLICSYCGHQNPTGAIFCIRCGRHLGEPYT